MSDKEEAKAETKKDKPKKKKKNTETPASASDVGKETNDNQENETKKEKPKKKKKKDPSDGEKSVKENSGESANAETDNTPKSTEDAKPKKTKKKVKKDPIQEESKNETTESIDKPAVAVKTPKKKKKESKTAADELKEEENKTQNADHTSAVEETEKTQKPKQNKKIKKKVADEKKTENDNTEIAEQQQQNNEVKKKPKKKKPKAAVDDIVLSTTSKSEDDSKPPRRNSDVGIDYEATKLSAVSKTKNKEKVEVTEEKRQKAKPRKGQKKTDNSGKNNKMDNHDDVMLTDDQYNQMLEAAVAFAHLKRMSKRHEQVITTANESLTRIEDAINRLERAKPMTQLIWKIDNFKRCFVEARKGTRKVLYSPEIISHRFGYKMAISLCPNGDGSGAQTHMSLFFSILKGDYDELLPWPFACKLSFTLMDQTNGGKYGREHIIGEFNPNPNPQNIAFLGQPTEFRNPSLGLPKFASLVEMWDNPEKYILNDTVFIKVEIDITGLDVPLNR